LNEFAEEIEGNVRDHTIAIKFSPDWVLAGGSGAAVVSDGCTPDDHPECEHQSIVVMEATIGGALQAASLAGNGITVHAKPTYGEGTLTVRATSGEIATSGAATVPVIGPEEVRIEPVCGRDGATEPFLAAPAEEVRIHWDYYVAGHFTQGETGQVHVDAPGLVLVAREYNGARFLTPTEAGAVPVSSTVGNSRFEYQIYDPATATLAPLLVTDGMATYREQFTVEAYTEVDGRPTCVDSRKTIRSDTPALCAIDAGDELVEAIDTTAARIQIMALAPGVCSISGTHAATGQSASIQFEIDPVPVRDRGWDGTCEVEPGTTCGVRCPDLACWKMNGCARSPGGTMSCLGELDPDDPDPECAAKAGNTISTSVDEVLCWPTATP
jgi:hypothetical protein